MNPFNKMFKHKGSNTAVFLGCGPSINNVTKKQWKMISKFDVWTSNNFIYHDFIPKFYHVEIKKNKNFDIWKHWRHNIKGKEYDDVIFIIKDHPKRKFLLEAIGCDSKYIYGYHVRKINNEAKNIIPNYKISSKYLTCNCNASFTMILEMLYKFKYEKIILFGVDLKDSRYFWSDNSINCGGKSSRINATYKGEKIHCNFNKNNQPDKPHTTSHLVNYIIGFNEKYMKLINCKIFVGHKNTSLYPGLPYIDILKL